MPKIKICGLFRAEDIAFVNEAEPDYIGFVFARSRRQVRPAEAARLRDRLKPGIAPVGVFVNAPVEDIVRLYRDGTIGLAQLHGTEDENYIAELKSRCAAPVIKAFRSEALSDPAGPSTGADYLLFDSGPGGTGEAFNWSLLEAFRGGVPWFLAGGVNLGNIAQAARLKPYCIDVSSGAETAGLKDREKILELVRQTYEQLF
ncbi:MAG: phosphoribosylanthranilate isomerase [Spirochaetaceae bacterium]|nr:phosphoribosylanthranilate isomerase [Spirochaetaceae bacterium]